MLQSKCDMLSMCKSVKSNLFDFTPFYTYRLFFLSCLHSTLLPVLPERSSAFSLRQPSACCTALLFESASGAIPEASTPSGRPWLGCSVLRAIHRRVEQRLARLAHNQKVAGSNPALATNLICHRAETASDAVSP